MKRTVLSALLLQFLVLPLFAADPPKECTLCVGVVLPAAPPATPLPIVEVAMVDGLAQTGERIDRYSPAQRRQTLVVFTYPVDTARDPLTQVEAQTKTIVDWAKLHGPFDALALNVGKLDPATAARMGSNARDAVAGDTHRAGEDDFQK